MVIFPHPHSYILLKYQQVLYEQINKYNNQLSYQCIKFKLNFINHQLLEFSFVYQNIENKPFYKVIQCLNMRAYLSLHIKIQVPNGVGCEFFQPLVFHIKYLLIKVGKGAQKKRKICLTLYPTKITLINQLKSGNNFYYTDGQYPHAIICYRNIFHCMLQQCI